jgi:hypothetical protein
MKKRLKSKIFYSLIIFAAGFCTHLLISKINFSYFSSHLSDERIAVSPEEFDRDQLHGSFEKRFGIDRLSDTDSDVPIGDFDISPLRKEDTSFVYYEIPLKNVGGNNKLNVEIKDGYIHLNFEKKEESSSQSMEQVFSIDSNLDDRKAEVINEKDKIIIKVPKKKV